MALNYAGNEQAAQQTVAEATKLGAKALAVRGDISSEQDVIAMFDRAEAELGPLKGVVLNAGIVAQTMPLADMSAERLKTCSI